MPVVDVGALLGCSGPPAPTRFVTLRVGQRLVALALEEVLGFRALSDDSLADLPPLLEGASGEAVAAVARLDGELLLLLHSARLMPDSVWSKIPGGAA